MEVEPADLKKRLLDDDDLPNGGFKVTETPQAERAEITDEVRQLKTKAEVDANVQEIAKDKDKNSWQDSDATKTYGVMYTLRYILPFLWTGGFWVKIQLVTTIFLIITAKVLNVAHPIILKMLIDTLTEGKDGYFYVGAYVIVKFAADFVNNLREVTFAHVSANAETKIALTVYTHI